MEVSDNLNSNRKPIQKVDQMSPRDFLRFLRKVLPMIQKDGTFPDLSVRITEKIDGSAFRLAVLSGKMLFESSYSGLRPGEFLAVSGGPASSLSRSSPTGLYLRSSDSGFRIQVDSESSSGQIGGDSDPDRKDYSGLCKVP